MARSLNSGVVIATDDSRIAAEARRFGGHVRMTRGDHPSGTDRLAEVASAETADIYVNIQGDEPLLDPGAIDAAVLGTLGQEEIPMGTLKRLIEDPAEVTNPNVVKVVTNLRGEAIYFSRHTIPFDREPGPTPPARYKHIGLYVYRRDLLMSYPDLPIGPLERAERLEQLRALENGYRIQVIETEYESLGVDTPEDLARLQRMFDSVPSQLSAPTAAAKRASRSQLRSLT